MELSIIAVSRDLTLWDYVNTSQRSKQFYVGGVEESYLEGVKIKIKGLEIKLFSQISFDTYTVFNQKQLKQIAKEIAVIEKTGGVNKKDLGIIKQGIAKALKENLYLKFEYD